MSEGSREVLQNRLHASLIVVCAWLVATSPWVAMLRRVPSEAGFFDHAHIVIGALGVLLSLSYAFTCMRRGRWRNLYPWIVGEVRPLARDVTGMFQRRIPSAEGGGLFAVIEGLLLAALLLVAITGAGWWLAQGSSAALDWRAVHVVGARVLIVVILAHAFAVATHLVELA